MKYDEANQALVLDLLKTLTVSEVARRLGVQRHKINYILRKKIKPVTMTSETRSKRIRDYLFKKHGELRLTVKQAFDEIGTFARGKDLGEELNTARLPSLGISDIARYIVLYT